MTRLCQSALIIALLVATSSAGKPNFILIVADDLGYGDISCYGNKNISTPNLDTLAAQGLRFTDFHSSGSVCSPTRAGLMTGCYPQRVGVPGVVTAASNRDHGLDTAFITMPEVLKKAGYATAMYGKWHLGYLPKYNPFMHGFDEFRGFVSGNVDYFSHVDQEGYFDWWQDTVQKDEEGYITDLITNHGIDYIKRNKDTSFFLYLSHGCPHSPYQGPNGKPFRVVKPGKTQKGVPGQTTAQKKRVYKAMIEHMDKGIGEIVDTLKALGIEKNTLVLFFSDNGPVAAIGSSGGLKGSKGTIFEGGHRVPALAWWPETIEAARTTDETVVCMDLYPTFASMGGITMSGIDGIDVSSVFLGSGEPLPERTLFWFSNGDYGVRQGKWKLNRVNGNVALHNLEADRKESNNVASGNADTRKSLVAALADYQEDFKNLPEVTWKLKDSSVTPLVGRSERFQISLAAAETIEFYSLDGRQVLRSDIRWGRVADLSALPAGVFLARYLSADGRMIGSKTMFHSRGR